MEKFYLLLADGNAPIYLAAAIILAATMVFVRMWMELSALKGHISVGIQRIEAIPTGPTVEAFDTAFKELAKGGEGGPLEPSDQGHSVPSEQESSTGPGEGQGAVAKSSQDAETGEQIGAAELEASGHESDASAGKQDPLEASWREFRKHLLINGAARRTRSAAEFFDSDIIASSINLRLYQTAPHILVGLGLLFTFVALMAALHFAAKGVAGNDTAVALGALKELLQAASLKFSTSVAGLFSSIAVQVAERMLVYRREREIAVLAEKIDEKIPLVTTEILTTQVETAVSDASNKVKGEENASLAALERAVRSITHEGSTLDQRLKALMEGQTKTSQPLEALASGIEKRLPVWDTWSDDLLIESKEQTAQLKRFNTDLAVSIAAAIEQRLTPQFSAGMEAIGERLDNLGNRIEAANDHFREDMLSQLGTAVTGETQQGINQLQSSLAQLTQTMGSGSTDLANQFARVMDSFDLKMAALATSMETMSEKMALSLGQATSSALEGLVRDLQESFRVTIQEQLATLVADLGESGRRLQRSAETVQESLDRTLIGLERETSALNSTLRAATEAFSTNLQEATVEAISQVRSEFSSQLTSQTSGELAGLRDQIADVSRTLEGSSAAVRDNIDDSLGRLAEQIEGLRATLDHGGEAVSRQLTSGASDAADLLVESATRFQEAAEHLNEGSRELAGTMQGASAREKQAQEALQSLIERIRQSHGEFQKSLETLAKTAEPLNVSAGRIHEAALALRQTQQGSEALLREVATQLGNAATMVKSGTEGLGEVAARAQAAWQSYQERFEKVDVDVQNVFKALGNGVEAYSEGVRDFVNDLGKSFKDASSSLSSAIEELGDVVEALESKR